MIGFTSGGNRKWIYTSVEHVPPDVGLGQSHMDIKKKQIGKYIEINPEGFEGWDRVDIFLRTFRDAFNFKDDDVDLRIVYKPNDPPFSPPTLGIKITYLSPSAPNAKIEQKIVTTTLL